MSVMTGELQKVEAWHQWTNEPDDVYVRFIHYRNIGPTRTLQRAYHKYLKDSNLSTHAGGKKLKAPGSWTKPSKVYDWVKRASAWDIHNMQSRAANIAALYVSAVVKLADRCAREAGTMKFGADGFPDLLASMKTVAEFLSPEVVRAIQEANKQSVALNRTSEQQLPADNDASPALHSAE